MALAAAIRHGEQTHRILAELDEPWGHDPRFRKARFELSTAGRALGNSYDALSALARIIRES